MGSVTRGATSRAPRASAAQRVFRCVLILLFTVAVQSLSGDDTRSGASSTRASLRPPVGAAAAATAAAATVEEERRVQQQRQQQGGDDDGDDGGSGSDDDANDGDDDDDDDDDAWQLPARPPSAPSLLPQLWPLSSGLTRSSMLLKSSALGSAHVVSKTILALRPFLTDPMRVVRLPTRVKLFALLLLVSLWSLLHALTSIFTAILVGVPPRAHPPTHPTLHTQSTFPTHACPHTSSRNTHHWRTA